MKKMMKIAVVLAVFALLTPVVYADEVDNTQNVIVDIDTETQEEVEIIKDGIGASIRLLQLEKSILKNIIKGEEVVSFLKELEYNTTDLEAILAELELLIQEVQSADPNSTDSVQIFVDLKSDAIELTKEFREKIEELLDEATIEQLRLRIREMVSDQVQNLTKRIQNHIRTFNRNQLHRIYGLVGEFDNSTINQYQNGSLTKEQVKNQISKFINNMTKAKKYQIFSELKEEKIRLRVQARAHVDNVTVNFQERKEMRLRNRIQNALKMVEGPVRAEIQNRITVRMNNLKTDNSKKLSDIASSAPGANGGNNKNAGGS
ncbi:MAG: hypothetical protein JXA91_02945 [Candidatus Thermoplasmatota archaeon]|nr:hypothetical protein [Candidatus Thermoplasmatota archaeon]